MLHKEPDVGLHHSNHVHLDANVLLKELLMAIGELSGVGGMVRTSVESTCPFPFVVSFPCWLTDETEPSRLMEPSVSAHAIPKGTFRFSQTLPQAGGESPAPPLMTQP